MSRQDPDVPYRYKISMGYVTCVRFAEAQGLKVTTKINSQREGGNNRFEHSMIEGATYDDLVIKKGFYSAGSEFFDWVRRIHIASVKVERVTLSLIVLNDKFEETGRYNIYNAFPVEYEGPQFNANAKEIAFEQIKIHYDYFEYRPGNALTGFIHAVGDTITNITGIG